MKKLVLLVFFCLYVLSSCGIQEAREEAKKEEYDKASPLNYVAEDYPPCMLIHGSTDNVVRLKDSTKFYEKLIEFKRPASLHIFSEEEHAFDGKPDYGRAIADLQALFFFNYL